MKYDSTLKGIRPILLFLAAIMIIACSTGRQSYQPFKKFPKEKLQQDFQLFRNVLEEGHPSLYWYTPKDSVNYYFDVTYAMIKDSMTEQKFYTLVSYMLSKIRCGHTYARYSKNYLQFLDTARFPQFPLSIKFWEDSAIVYANLNRHDTVIKTGTLVTGINNKPMRFYRDSLFQYLSMDGNGLINKYQTLSNLGTFSGWYRNIFGLSKQFVLNYTDEHGKNQSASIPLFDPKKDTTRDSVLMDYKKMDRKVRRHNSRLARRSLVIDTTNSTGYLVLNTFLRGNGLSAFIKESFRTLQRAKVKNLIIDVRNNGGGNVGISNLLTRYLVDHPYKLADSLYAINRRSHYGKYINGYFWNRLSMNFVSAKRADGHYHFGYFERHFFKPKKSFHYNGDVYVLTGGNSFSATSIFAYTLKGQRNVLLVGEETGGGAYGNTAWLIPEVTLPNTKVRFTSPKFRMVINKDAEKNGRGVMPDVFARPSLQSIRDELDPKLDKVKSIIRERRNK